MKSRPEMETVIVSVAFLRRVQIFLLTYLPAAKWSVRPRLRAFLVQTLLSTLFTARRYAIAVYAVIVCLSVRTAGTVPKLLNIGARKKYLMLAQ